MSDSLTFSSDGYGILDPNVILNLFQDLRFWFSIIILLKNQQFGFCRRQNVQK